MAHRQLIASAVLCTILLSGCGTPFVPIPTATGTLTAPPGPKNVDTPGEGTPTPEQTPCPACSDMLHVVTIYAMHSSPAEAEPLPQNYVITVEDFRQEHIWSAGFPEEARIDLLDETVLPVAAWGRKVDNVTKPPVLTEQAEPITWRLYIRSSSSTEITCAPVTDGLSWQEVLAFVEPGAVCPSAAAYSQTSTEVCYMPPGTTTEQLGDNAFGAPVWIDAAVFDLKDGAFGLVRFGPIPGSGAGPRPCDTVCKPIKCKNPVGCFLHSVCKRVCSR